MEKTVKMMLWYQSLKASLRNEKGQGMVEYGLILALIAVGVVLALGTLGGDISAKFTAISTELTK